MEVHLLTQEELTSKRKAQINDLFKQLSPNKTQQDLAYVLNSTNPIVFVQCVEADRLLGIATMTYYRVISGYKGWIEDVVVDENQRGRGIGTKLIHKLLDEGQSLGLTEILLFTEDHRHAAIQLYSRLGFVRKDTRIYVHR